MPTAWPLASHWRGRMKSSPQSRGTSERVRLDELRVIAGHDVERFAVRPQEHGMRPVLAAAGDVA